MNTSNWMKQFAAIAGSAVIGLMLATGVYAAGESVIAEVEFVTPVSIGENESLRFGLLDVGLLGTESIILAPDDSTSGDTGRIAGGVQGAADLTITATGSQGITITADNPSVATGYTLGTWMCNYDGGTDTNCSTGYNATSAVSGSATLLVGVTLSGNGSAVVGADDSTFDVTVIYQ